MTRVRIARINLHLKGVAPAAAQDAARLLGPALARALAARGITPGSRDEVDGGRESLTAAPSGPGLAAHVAQRIARATSRE
jgi:hypothetical protein